MDWFLRSLDILIIALLVLGGFLYLYARASKRARLLERTLAEVKRHGKSPHENRRSLRDASSMIKQLLKRLGSAVPLLNESQRIEASGKLVAAGYRSNQALFTLAGIILVFTLGLFVALIIYARPFLHQGGALYWLIALIGCVYVGSLLPRFVLDILVKRRQEAIRLALPDALDLLVITTNAGLALNAALDRVATELVAVAPALADELKLTAMQLRISSDTDQVLEGLARRTGLDSMRSLVNTLIQARQYGTAVTQALRILAKSERTARMMRLEEQAAKLAVKITLPMMIFILPTVMIVAAGPAILSMIKTFSSM